MNAHPSSSIDTTRIEQEITGWIRQHAIPLATTAPEAPLDDLESLRRLIGDAVVVGLGGSTYGAREQFTLTHRVVRFLVEELGFRTVAIEEDWDKVLELDHYALTGEGDLDALMADTGAPWRNQEIRDALTWMRDYNAEHDAKVRFVGVGVIDTRAHVYDTVTRYIEKVASDRLPELREHFEPIRPTSPTHVRWFTMEVKDKEPYVEHARQAQRIVEELPHTAGDREHELIVQHARQIVAFYEHYAYHLIDDGYRDQKMAENLHWWHEYTGHKIAYWSTHAHSANASRLTVSLPPRADLVFKAAGAHLRELFGAQYVSIGLTFDHGTVNSAWAQPPTFTPQPLAAPSPPPDFAEHPLGQVGVDHYALDLHAANGSAARSWLDAPAKTRVIGSVYDAGMATQFYMTGGALTEWFDVIIHTQTLTPTRVL